MHQSQCRIRDYLPQDFHQWGGNLNLQICNHISKFCSKLNAINFNPNTTTNNKQDFKYAYQHVKIKALYVQVPLPCPFRLSILYIFHSFARYVVVGMSKCFKYDRSFYNGMNYVEEVAQEQRKQSIILCESFSFLKLFSPYCCHHLLKPEHL